MNDRTREGRLGLLLSVVWLGFLYFPLQAIWSTAHPLEIQLLATSLVVIFAASYGWGFLRYGPGSPQLRAQIVILITLATLVAGTTALTGPPALAMTPFLVAFASYSLPPRRAMIIAPALLLLTIGTLAMSWTLTEMIPILTLSPGLLVSGIATGRSIETSRQIASLEHEQLRLSERNAIARDVHDLLGHSLTVIGLKAQLAERLVEQDPQRATAELAQIRTITSEALNEVRKTVAGARSLSLSGELERARQTLDSAGIKLTIVNNTAVSEPQEQVMAWVVRESVTNVVRHANAKKVHIEINAHQLRISDDGVGFSREPGHGISGMQERVANAGGALRLGVSGLGGALVEVTW